MGSQTQAASFAALQGQHLVSVVLNDDVTVAEIVRWSIRLVYLRGIIMLIRLGFRILASPCGKNSCHSLYFVMVLW